MGYDKRHVPGPGHYEPRRERTGGANKCGESEGAFSSTQHGFSVTSGPSRDYSFYDYSFNNPWFTYPRGSVVAKKLAIRPGPILPRTTFGPQVDSTKVSEPAHTFAKEAIHADSKISEGLETPGPNHYDVSNSQSVGAQKLSTKRSNPRYTIAGKVAGIQPPESPGPSDYDSWKATTVGGYLDNSRKVKLDKARRFLKDPLSNVPGPGEYDHVVSLGTQVGSTKPTKPSFAFTKSKMYRTEDASDPTYIGKMYIQDRLGRDSPGPQAHEVRMTYKGISLIKGKGRGVVTFTKDQKMRPFSSEGFYNPNNPGPGAYKVVESMGKQVLSTVSNAAGTSKSSMDRSQWNKIFIGKDHVVFDRQGVDSPGPKYFVDKDSRGRATTPSADGTGHRFGTQAQRPKTAAELEAGPGPGAYDVARTFDAPKDLRGNRPATSAAVLPGFDFSSELRACLKEFDDISPRGDLYLGKDFDISSSLGLDAPGPGSYITGSNKYLASSIGGANPVLPKQPSWKFSTAKRQAAAAVPTGSGELGPGNYDVPGSLGAQSESRRKSGPRFTISRGDRDKERALVYNGQTKAVGGEGAKDGPGPQAYDSSKWTLHSKKKKGPSFTFGKEPRTSLFLYV